MISANLRWGMTLWTRDNYCIACSTDGKSVSEYRPTEVRVHKFRKHRQLQYANFIDQNSSDLRYNFSGRYQHCEPETLWYSEEIQIYNQLHTDIAKPLSRHGRSNGITEGPRRAWSWKRGVSSGVICRSCAKIGRRLTSRVTENLTVEEYLSAPEINRSTLFSWTYEHIWILVILIEILAYTVASLLILS